MENYLKDTVEYDGSSFMTDGLINECARFVLTNELKHAFYEYEHDFECCLEHYDWTGCLNLRNNNVGYKVVLECGFVQSVKQIYPPKIFTATQVFDAIRASIDAMVSIKPRPKSAVVLFSELGIALQALVNCHLYTISKCKGIEVDVNDIYNINAYPNLNWTTFAYGVIGSQTAQFPDNKYLIEQITQSEKKLANPLFIERAPAKIVAKERTKLYDLKEKLKAQMNTHS